MPFNGSGGFVRVMDWTNDAAAGIKIRADRHDQEDDNFAAGLSQCITKDGQTQPTANIPMNAKKIVNLANPTAAQDAATKAYVDGAIQNATVTVIQATGTWNRPAGCTHVSVEIQAGGGSGGAITITAATAAAGGGGGGGGDALIHFVDVTGSASAAVAIGGGGTAGPGGDTQIAFASGGPTYRVTGGNNGGGMGGTAGLFWVQGGAGQTSGTVPASGAQNGQPGFVNMPGNLAMSGAGGSSRFGVGGPPTRLTTNATGNNGSGGNGFGAGGSGAVAVNLGTSWTGGAGTAGWCRITEYYGLS